MADSAPPGVWDVRDTCGVLLTCRCFVDASISAASIHNALLTSYNICPQQPYVSRHTAAAAADAVMSLGVTGSLVKQAATTARRQKAAVTRCMPHKTQNATGCSGNYMNIGLTLSTTQAALKGGATRLQVSI